MALLNICIGGEFFNRMREEDRCYVDKTRFIEELLVPNQPLVSLITRPRRFGKTLTMTMLRDFFAIDKESKALFEGLAISRNTELCEKWMNQYPTIFLTFKGIEGRNFDSALARMADLLQDICLEHAYLLESQKVDAESKERLSTIKRGVSSENVMAGALKLLCRALETHWERPVILLIDEYDVPINCAEQNGYYREMVDFMRNILGATIKTNKSLKFAVLTGCLRIAKESIFTGLNNFRCYGISDDQFSDKIGFTAQEVEQLLNSANLIDKKNVLQEWYDGYCFGNTTEIYCPWDVLLYIDDLQSNPSAKPKAYWNNTSGNSIVRTLINQAQEATIKQKIERLISGQAIEEELNEELTYDVIYQSENNIWTMLYLTGYLTKTPDQPDNENTSLTIPNKEVLKIFTNTISKWFNESLKKEDLSPFVAALWSGDNAKVQETLTRILYDTISYYDSAENYYHGFMSGLIRGAGLPITSNRESGLGRTDIVAEDGYNKRAIIIELKYAREYRDLEKKAQEGLAQIKDRNYAASLSSQIREVICYGISFWKKESNVAVYKFIREEK